MKKSQLNTFITVLLVILITAALNASASTINHVSLSLENCAYVTPSVIEFDIYATSDGSSESDVRPNAFQVGINFNTGILNPGSKMSVSYIEGSSDFQNLNGFNFPVSRYSDHIRIVQSVYSKGNTGKKMETGKPYRIGTFRLTGSSNFAANQNPNFSFQTNTFFGKTTCAAIAWIGNVASTSATAVASIDPSGINERKGVPESNLPILLTASINCRIENTSLLELENEIRIYPNPASGITTISFQSQLSGDYHLRVFDMTDREVLSQDVKATIGINLIKIDLTQFSKGVYVINLKGEDFNSSGKAVIE